MTPNAGKLAWIASLTAILAIAVVSYHTSTDGEFVWDDRPLIVEDDAIKSADGLTRAFTNDFFFRHENDLSYGYYRPLATVSYAVDYALYGLEPRGFHATNIALHAVCSLLVALVLISLGFGRGAAWAAGALFAAHPIHTESVAWISGRTDVLAFLLGAASLLLHARARAGAVQRRISLLMRFASVLFFAAALLAKEMAVVIAAWIALCHATIWFSGWKRAAIAWAPYALVALAYAVVRFAILDVGGPGQPGTHTAWGTLLSAPSTIVRYLVWMLWPVEQSAYVQNPYVTSLADLRFLGGAAALLAALVWSARRLRRDRADLPAFLTLALFSSFLPVLNLVRVAAPEDMGAVMAERFSYFPSLPFLALIAVGAAALWKRLATSFTARAALRAAGLLVVAAAVLATMKRNEVWRDDRTLFEDALETAPNADLLLGNLAVHHIREGRLDEAREVLSRFDDHDKGGYYHQSARVMLDVARKDFEAAITPQEAIAFTSSRSNPVPRNNLAFLYRMTGRAGAAAALLEEIIEEGRGYGDVWFNLAEIRREQGRFDDAAELYDRALEEKRGELRYGTALASMELGRGRPKAARAVFEALLEEHPDDPGLLNNLAIAAQRDGDEEAAIEAFEAAVLADPSYARARLGFARLLISRGERRAAARQLEAIIGREGTTPMGQEARRLLDAIR